MDTLIEQSAAHLPENTAEAPEPVQYLSGKITLNSSETDIDGHSYSNNVNIMKTHRSRTVPD